MPEELEAERRRSGSETRRRTARLDLRLLPSEQRALRVLADQGGHRSVQSWILEALRPQLDRIELSSGEAQRQ
jgi:hypothetical protein